MDQKSNPSEAAQQEEVRDRARRRLLKLGGYLTPTLLSLTALLDPRSGYAQGSRITPEVGKLVAAVS